MRSPGHLSMLFMERCRTSHEQLLSGILLEDEIFKAPFRGIIFLCKALEQFAHELMEPILLNGIEVVLSVSARFDQAGDPEERQMMTDGGLALSKPLTECGDMKFFLSSKEKQNLQTRFIREQFEDLDKVLLQLVRQFRNTVPTCGRHRAFQLTGDWFGKLRNHFFFLGFWLRGASGQIRRIPLRFMRRVALVFIQTQPFSV